MSQPRGQFQSLAVGACTRDLLHELTKDTPYPEAARTMLAHVWACNKAAYREPEPVPISAVLILSLDSVPARTRTEDVWAPLKDDGLLRVTPHDRKFGLSREFAPTHKLVNLMLEASIEDAKQSTRYDATTLKKTSRCLKTEVTRETGDSWKATSRVLHRTLEALKGSCDFINVSAVEKHLAALRSEYQKAREAFADAIKWGGEADVYRAGQAFVRASARREQDERIMQVIRGQKLTQAQDQPTGVYTYRTAYRVQTASGRLTMIAGLQNASRAMKRAAVKDVQDVRNYDIKSSQTCLLRLEIEEAIRAGASLSLDPLDAYAEDGGRDGLADRTRIPRTYLGGPEHAVKFGAGFHHATYAEAWAWTQQQAGKSWTRHDPTPATAPHPTKPGARVVIESEEDALIRCLPTLARTARDLARADDVPHDDPEAVYGILREAFGDLAEMLDAWREWLLEEWWPLHEGPGGAYARTAPGPILPVSIFSPRCYDWSDGQPTLSAYLQKATLATALLQGREALFVHYVVLGATNHGYEVLRHEHDGLVVVGEVSEEAIRHAREKSGFSTAKFIEKDI